MTVNMNLRMPEFNYTVSPVANPGIKAEPEITEKIAKSNIVFVPLVADKQAPGTLSEAIEAACAGFDLTLSANELSDVLIKA
jgi:hypothetical protein